MQFDLYLEPCPFCGSTPQLVSYTRDRDLHPELDNIRYVCGTKGHIIAAPWVEASLGENKNSSRLIEEAQQTWSNFIRIIRNGS